MATWRGVLLTGVFACLTVVAVDLAVQTRVPRRRLMEVDEAVAQYEAGDPTVLVLGSSHARSFLTLGRVLSERTGSAERVQPVPVEWGKYPPYQ